MSMLNGVRRVSESTRSTAASEACEGCTKKHGQAGGQAAPLVFFCCEELEVCLFAKGVGVR